MVDQCLDYVTSELKSRIPDFGTIVAVDSTPVHSHCNPDKKNISDPEAGWIAKGGAGKHKDWRFGYRLHLIVDTPTELPISKELNLSKVQDMQEMPSLLRITKKRSPWFKPQVIIADKGYDGGINYDVIVKEFDADPIIPLSPKSQNPPPEITGSSAAPYCPGKLPLIYRKWEKNRGIQYGCPAKAGSVVCPLEKECGLKAVWIRPVHDYRRFGHRIKRGTEQWSNYYRKRSSVEHTFSRLKQTRRLERHSFRGFNNINIHATLSVLVMQAVALTKAKEGKMDEIRTCIRQVS